MNMRIFQDISLPNSEKMKIFNKVGLAIIRNKKVLVTREIDSKGKYFILGGKIEKNETDIQVLEREILEELGVKIEKDSLRYFGTFEDVAATDPNARVRIKLYVGEVIGEFKPSNEIKEIAWVGSSDDWSKLSLIGKIKSFLF